MVPLYRIACEKVFGVRLEQGPASAGAAQAANPLPTEMVAQGARVAASPVCLVQTFVTVGLERGDQTAIVKGVKQGDLVITSGQLKLKNGSPVIINNAVTPLNDAAPKPADQ